MSYIHKTLDSKFLFAWSVYIMMVSVPRTEWTRQTGWLL